MVMPTVRTPEAREKFLNELAATANVSRASLVAGFTPRAAYNWRKADSDFAAAWEEAVQIGICALEDEAVRRAAEGYTEPVFYQGAPIAEVRKYSDSLLMFLLQGRAPDKYRPNFQRNKDDDSKIIIEGGLPPNNAY